MIKIYPFKALVPPANLAAEVASEPYDVISTSEARERAAGKPNSYLHVVRSEIDLPHDTDPYDSAVYETALKNLDSMVANGVLAEEKSPSIFLYRQIYQDRPQIGVVCCYDVEQYRSGNIKKHEKTRPDKEDDRTRHMTVCGAHAEPVFLTFQDHPVIQQLIDADSKGEPVFDFVAPDGVAHTAWRVSDPQFYVTAFEEVESAYIADGHHRTAGGERAATQRQTANPNHTGQEEYNRVMAVMFPANQLRILAYNRVVNDLNGLTANDFVMKLAMVGNVEPTNDPVPANAGTVCIYIGNRWYQLTFDPNSIDQADPINSLDVALLQSRILEPILGVGDPRTDHRIGFVGGIRGTEELERRVNSGDVAVAFSMYPTSIEQLINVSDQGQVMPPKSTWFEPKLRSGLFVHRF